MWSLFQRKVRQTKPSHRKLASIRLRLEALEDRCVPSGAGSLDPTFGNCAGYVTTSTTAYFTLSPSSDFLPRCCPTLAALCRL